MKGRAAYDLPLLMGFVMFFLSYYQKNCVFLPLFQSFA